MCNELRTESPAQARYRQQRRRRALGIRLARYGILVGFLLLWEVLARVGAIDPFLLSSPSRMVATIAELIRTGEMWLHLGTTLWETVVGFVLGSLLGIALAIALWWSDTLTKILDPYLVVLNALPKIALGPVLIVWIGAGTTVLAGVSIGDNTVIGAGSVVTKPIPANVVAAGVPCRVLRPVTEQDRYRYPLYTGE